MPRRQGRHALAVEARHHPGHGIARPSPDRPGRRTEAGPIRDRQERRGPRDPIGALAARPGDLLQLSSLGGRQRPQWFLLVARHRPLLGSQLGEWPARICPSRPKGQQALELTH